MTRYDFFRRRIAPVLFLGMVGLIAYDTCQKEERTHATIVLGLGDAEPRVRAVDAELIVQGEVIGQFHRRALPGLQIGPCRFEAAMPDEQGELRIDVELGPEGGPLTRRRVVRQVRAAEGSTVTIPLAAELR